MTASVPSHSRHAARTLLLLALAALSARAETRSASQLTCLVDSGELLPGTDEGELGSGFDFERLASRRSGRDSRVRLVSSLEQPGLLPGVTTSAALRLDVDLDQLPQAPLRDAGSRLGVAWQGAGLTAALRAYPFDTDYVRLGYLHALDWGGTDVARGESVFGARSGGAPGAELELSLPRIRIGLAAKWTRQGAGPGDERRWGALLRGSFDFLPALRLDAGLGYFQRPAPLEPAAGSSFVEGASLRAVWHRGAPEPELAAEPFRPPTLRDEAQLLEAPSPTGMALALEGVTLVRRLRDLEDRERSSLSASPALGIYGSARGRSLAVHLAATWRSLGFVLRNSSGLLDGAALPAQTIAQAELAAWLGGSATLLPWQLTPSLELGCLLPAALQAEGAVPGLVQTFVVRGPAQIEALPLGAARLPILVGRVGLRLQLSSAMAIGLFGSYERDANRVRWQSRAGAAVRTFATPDSVRFSAAAWSRF